MKANLLVFVAVVIIAVSACQVRQEMITFNNPTITIKDVNVINSYKGKVICYTINLYSPSSLSEFVATPKIAGDNSSSSTKFEFNDHARRATVTYYYEVPEEVDSSEISVCFCLNNSLQEINSMTNPCLL